MKINLILLFLIVGSLVANGQVISGKSGKKKVTFTKTQRAVVTKLPDLIITGEKFIDENQNNFINANESSVISLMVENIGEGLAENVPEVLAN